MIKQKFKVKGMHCVGCAMVIDDKVESIEGVKSASANYARQVVEVEYDEHKVTVQTIASVVKQTGYTLICEE